MKYIIKRSSPRCLIDYKKNNPGATYEMFRNGHKRYKNTKQALLEDQGYICCYCGSRIQNDSSSQIEHFFPKGTNLYDIMQLDYDTNLLVCCDGGKNSLHNGEIDKNDLFCEARKGDLIIPVNPMTIECENKFLFDEYGEIIGVSPDAEVTIAILNLTSPIITNKRKAAIKYYLDYPIKDWQAEFDRLSQKDNGKYEEFCFVLQRYIEMYHGDELKTIKE